MSIKKIWNSDRLTTTGPECLMIYQRYDRVSKNFAQGLICYFVWYYQLLFHYDCIFDSATCLSVGNVSIRFEERDVDMAWINSKSCMRETARQHYAKLYHLMWQSSNLSWGRPPSDGRGHALIDLNSTEIAIINLGRWCGHGALPWYARPQLYWFTENPLGTLEEQPDWIAVISQFRWGQVHCRGDSSETGSRWSDNLASRPVQNLKLCSSTVGNIPLVQDLYHIAVSGNHGRC